MLLWEFTADPPRLLQPQLQALVQNVTVTISPNSTGALPAKWPRDHSSRYLHRGNHKGNLRGTPCTGRHDTPFLFGDLCHP